MPTSFPGLSASLPMWPEFPGSASGDWWLMQWDGDKGGYWRSKWSDGAWGLAEGKAAADTLLQRWDDAGGLDLEVRRKTEGLKILYLLDLLWIYL